MPGWGGGGDASDAVTGGDEITRLRDRFKALDPLTEEPFDGDQRFELHVVIRRIDTPPALIPEEYKPAADAKAADASGAPARRE